MTTATAAVTAFTSERDNRVMRQETRQRRDSARASVYASLTKSTDVE